MNRYGWQLILLVTLLSLIAAGKNLARAGSFNPSDGCNGAESEPASAGGGLFGLAPAGQTATAILVNPGQSICLTFDTGTAAYTFKACIPGGFNLSGTGTVQTVNNVAVLTDTKPDRRVVAYFFLNQLTGHAAVTQITSAGVFHSFTINSNVPNPTCNCP